MRYPLAILTGLTALAAWLPGATAPAQNPARYRPATPTLSPWLNTSRQDRGALDAYHTFVRPQMEFQELVQQQEAVNRRNHAELSGLGDKLLRIENAEGVHATGTGGTFMNYSHYYYQRLGTSPAGAAHVRKSVGR